MTLDLLFAVACAGLVSWPLMGALVATVLPRPPARSRVAPPPSPLRPMAGVPGGALIVTAAGLPDGYEPLAARRDPAA